MSPEGRRIELNASQLRGLRNWPAHTLPDRTGSVVVPVPEGAPIEVVRQAVIRLAARHEGLRSRLVTDDTGRWQQVLDDQHPLRDPELVTVAPLAEGERFDPVAAGDRLLPVDPAERSMRCLIHCRGGRAYGVQLSLSHLFADGVSQLLLSRELAESVAHPELPRGPARAQASDFAGDLTADRVKRSTEGWKQLLAGVPRACTYSGTPRSEQEEERWLRVTLTADQAAGILRASRALRVTPFLVWITAASVLVSRYTGQHAMTFKAQMANRSTPTEFEAVAQLAQGSYLPLPGTAADTVLDRARTALDSTLRASALGMHDSAELLHWLDSGPVRNGSVFRPAFEINYAAPLGSGRLPQLAYSVRPSTHNVRIRHDPDASAADLGIEIWQCQELTSVILRAKAPLLAIRSAEDILADLLVVLRALQTPDSTVQAVPVDRLPGRDAMLTDPRSGVALDPELMSRLLTCDSRVVSASFLPRPAGTRAFWGISAEVVVDRPVPAEELLNTYTARQRWLDGTLVPAELSVSTLRQETRHA